MSTSDMWKYSLESSQRKAIKLSIVAVAGAFEANNFLIGYKEGKCLCQFERDSRYTLCYDALGGQYSGVPRYDAVPHSPQDIMVPWNTTPHHPPDINQWRSKYLRIEILKNDVCLYSAVGPLKLNILFRDFFDMKMVGRQHPDLFLTGVLEIALTIGTLENLRTSGVTSLPVAREKMTLPVAPEKTTMESLKVMLDKSILTDVVIRTKKKDFPCHKVILASSSEVFRAMFVSDMSESSDGVVTLEQFDAATMQDLLYYLYTKNTPPGIKTTCENLFVAADYFKVASLKWVCTKMLHANIRVENAASILKLSETYNVEALKEHAMLFIAKNLQRVISTPEWNSIPDQMAKKLLNTCLFILSKQKCSQK